MFELLKDGLLVNLAVTPKASRTAIKGVHNGRIKLLIPAPPADGQANEAVIEFFAKLCGLPKRAISIKRGQTSRKKTIRIETNDPVTIRKSIESQIVL